MSVKISGKVWELDLDPIEKLIALALAEYASHEGKNVRPGNDLLCAMTGLSQPTISSKIGKFIEAGLLSPTDDGFGRGKKREFSINPDALPRRQYFIEKDEQKVKASFRYKGHQSNNAVIPFDGEKVKADEQKVKADERKVKADEFLHDKERARVLNRHEPSIEPEGESKPAAAINPDLTDSLANLLRDCLQIPESAGWRMADRIQSVSLELAMIGATVADLRQFWGERIKKPGLNFLVSDFVTWRAGRSSGSSVNGNGSSMNGQTPSYRPPVVTAPADYGRRRVS